MLTLRPSLRSLPMHPVSRRATALERALRGAGSVAWFSLGRDALGAMASWLADRSDGIAWLPAYACDQVRDPFVHAGCRIVEYDTTANLTIDVDHLVTMRRSMPGTHMFVVIDYFGFAQHFTSAEQSELRNAFSIIVRDAVQGTPHVSTEHLVGSEGGYALYSLRKATGWPEGCIAIATHGAPALRRPRVGGRDWLRARWFLAYELLMSRDRATPNGAPTKLLRQALLQRDAFGVWPHPVTPIILRRVDLDAIGDRRRRNATVIMAATEGWPLVRPLDEQDCPYYVPVLSANPDELVQHLRNDGIQATRFWPVAERAANGGWSNAAEIGRRIVCVPTHHGLTLPDATRIAAAIQRAALQAGPTTTT